MDFYQLKLIGKAFNAISHIAPTYAAKLAWRFFCTPISGKITTYHAEFLSPAKFKVYELMGIKMQAYKWGHGPRKVVFMHGWASNSFRWKNYIALLEPELFTVYAVDAPGHGYSSGSTANLVLFKESLDILLSEVGPVDTVVGHSIGGFATTYHLHDAKIKTANQAIIMASPGEVADFFTFFNDLIGLNDKLRLGLVNHFNNIIGRDPSYFSASRFAESIDLPSFIIHDTDDTDADYTNAVRLHTSWKNSELHTTTGLGHHLKDESIYQLIREKMLN